MISDEQAWAAAATNCRNALKLGWRVRPVPDVQKRYPLMEQDPRLAKDVAAFQAGVMGPQAETGALGSNTLRAMVGAVREWQARGAPEEGEVAQTIVRRLILPTIEAAPAPKTDAEIEEGGCLPPASDTRGRLSAGGLVGLVAAGLALYWLAFKYPGR